MGSPAGEGMEKYGVVLDETKTKTASELTHCPKCGEVLFQTSPPQCSKCGTEPFEKKD